MNYVTESLCRIDILAGKIASDRGVGAVARRNVDQPEATDVLAVVIRASLVLDPQQWLLSGSLPRLATCENQVSWG